MHYAPTFIFALLFSRHLASENLLCEARTCKSEFFRSDPVQKKWYRFDSSAACIEFFLCMVGRTMRGWKVHTNWSCWRCILNSECPEFLSEPMVSIDKQTALIGSDLCWKTTGVSNLFPWKTEVATALAAINWPNAWAELKAVPQLIWNCPNSKDFHSML